MTNLHETLAWLPPSPQDFKKRVRAASSIHEIRQLASYSLDESELNRLAQKLNSLLSENIDLSTLQKVNLGLVSNATSKLFSSSIISTGIRYGLHVQIHESEFDQVAQEAFSGTSSFNDKQIDIILLAVDFHGLNLIPSPGDEKSGSESVNQSVEFLTSAAQSISVKHNVTVILQNIATPPEKIFGSYDRALPGTTAWIISQINYRLSALKDERFSILDISGLAATVGLANWHDPVQWNWGKLPFSLKYLPIFSEYLCRLIAVRFGKSRKCLVLDLDNTIWGGVIGDDGVDGIVLGNGDSKGEAFLELQKVALSLREIGVVLAVSSKNDDLTARLPFREHSQMLLKEEHIAVFQANWSDKATNIRTIARELNLGLESMVFVDDNPAERMLVRVELPEVAVPEMPEDPALFARTLLSAGYFESLRFSDEDRLRAKMYQQNAKRANLLTSSSNIESYLISLDMKAYIAPFDKSSRARITQLINKSNQFNLTTRRYSESEILEVENDDTYFTMQIRLADSYGDNGLISVLICKKYPDHWAIDTWLMSCRVLGRRVEELALQSLLKFATKDGVSFLKGTYIPSAKNGLVKEHYLKMGFEKESQNSVDEKWRLAVKDKAYEQLPIAVQYAF